MSKKEFWGSLLIVIAVLIPVSALVALIPYGIGYYQNWQYNENGSWTYFGDGYRYEYLDCYAWSYGPLLLTFFLVLVGRFIYKYEPSAEKKYNKEKGWD